MGTEGRDPRNNHYPVGWFSVGCSYRPFRYNSWHDAVAGPMEFRSADRAVGGLIFSFPIDGLQEAGAVLVMGTPQG
jgi:hypothetical protein